MAEGNYRDYLKGELVRAKKYFYDEVKRLLDIKMNSPEIIEIPRIDRINRYLDKSIAEIKAILKNIDDKVTFDWNHLNRIFLEEIRKYK